MSLHIVLDGLTKSQLLDYKEDLIYYQREINKKLGIKGMKDYQDSEMWYSCTEEILADLKPDVSEHVYNWLEDIEIENWQSRELLEKIETTLSNWKKLNRIPFSEVKKVLGHIEDFLSGNGFYWNE